MSSDAKGFTVFDAVMNFNRFEFLLSKINFVDPGSRPGSLESDRFAAFRDSTETFNDNCSRYPTPDQFLCIDVMLYSISYHKVFGQHNLDKPAKYGLVFELKTLHVYHFFTEQVLRLGNVKVILMNFFIKELVKAMVNGIQKQVSLQGWNISMDCVNSDISLGKWFPSKKNYYGKNTYR